jgi:hypothetical protein
VKLRPLVVLVLAWGMLVLPAPASTRHMPISEVKAGMTGVGRTVFNGSTIEEFQVRILGVVRSNIGPQRDLILARLDGGPLAKAGVIAGMSGSPVYIDGRLVGAVSYSLGAFATEPIAGITPIAEMIDATTPGAASPGTRITPIPIGAGFAALSRAFADAVGPLRAFIPAAGDSRSISAATAGAWPEAAALRPIALPLTVGGLEGGAAGRVLSAFSSAGFVSAPGAPAPAPQVAATPAEALRPGDALGVALITGDFRFGATGTVTEVDGARIYAFGHPLYNLGPANFAMTRAYVHAVLPSLASSMKLASLGDVVGAMQQDRATAIAGTLGAPPHAIAMTVSLRREGGAARTFSFGLADHPLLTPLLAYTALVGVVSEYEHDLGPASYAVRGRAVLAGHPAVEFDDVYAGDQPGIAAAAAVAMPLASLLTNDIEAVRVESLHLDIDSAEHPRSATVERVWIDAAEVQRGKSVPVKILLHPWRGEDLVRTIEVDIPANAEGPLTLVVADGARFAQWEQREQRGALLPATVDQVIKAINESRRSNRLYVRLVGRDTGAIVNGEAMPSLPSSVLAVMQGDRGGAATPLLQTSMLGAWDLQMDRSVTGLRTLTLPLAGRRP